MEVVPIKDDHATDQNISKKFIFFRRQPSHTCICLIKPGSP